MYTSKSTGATMVVPIKHPKSGSESGVAPPFGAAAAGIGSHSSGPSERDVLQGASGASGGAAAGGGGGGGGNNTGDFDDDLQTLSYKAMHRFSLRFRSRHLEDMYQSSTLRRFRKPFGRTAPMTIPWLLLAGVPVMISAQEQGRVAPGSTAVLVAALLGVAIITICVHALSDQVLKRVWNVLAGVNNALFVTPVFVLLAVCVAEGVGPSMDECTPDYPDQQPLLPVITAVIAPLFMLPMSGCSWFVAPLCCALSTVVGTVCMFVGNVPAPVSWVACGIMLLSIVMCSHVTYLLERQLRSALWLRVANVRGAAVLARTEDERKDMSARNDAFQKFAASTGQLLYELDAHNCFFRVSGALEDFGVVEFDLIGKPHDFNVHPEDLHIVHETIANLRQPLQPGRTVVSQFRRMKDSANFVWVEMVAVVEKGSRSRALIASERDVTAEREAREAIAQERQRRIAATAAQAAHDETLGYACHELRNPLHVIQASLSFLKETHLDGEQTEHVSTVDIAARQMHTLVDDILDVDRLRAGKLAVQASATDVVALVKNAASQHRDFARVPVSAEIGPGIPPSVMVAGDRITQVLNNGMTNAAKFTSAGRICVRVMLGTALNTLRFEVRNSGVLPNRPLFRAFESTAASAATEHNGSTVKGTGLGLRISTSLVTALGGELNLQNMPVLAPSPDLPNATTETVFWFQIPYTASDVRSPLLPSPAHAAAAAERMSNNLGLHVMLVDDEPLNRRIGENMLKKLGCTAVVLEDGDQVMPNHPESFDAIFLDIIMQRQHGDETMRQMVAAGIRTPCFAVSGNTDQSSVQDYLRAGFHEVLGKPFTIEQIRRVLTQIATRHAGGIPGIPGSIV